MTVILLLILFCQVAIIVQLARLIKQGDFQKEDATVKNLNDELNEAQSHLPPQT